MATILKITSRECWEQLLARYPAPPTMERKRKHRRRDTAIGTAELTYERDGELVTRPGKLLNASPEGVALKQREWIAYATQVVIRVMLADGEAILAGRVTHATDTVGGFKVGIQLVFAGDADWLAPAQVRPVAARCRPPDGQIDDPPSR